MIGRARSRRAKTASPSRATTPPPTAPENVAPHVVARLVPLEPGFYAFSLAADTGWRDPVVGLGLPAVQICALPHQEGGIAITDSFGRAESWLGGHRNLLFVTAPPGGGAALVTGYLARDPNSAPLALDIRRIGSQHAAAPEPLMPATRLSIGGPVGAGQSPHPVGLDIVAHIRGRGDVRFHDAGWIGRLGPGSWIEGFMVFPHSRSAAAAIEYKGLAASGAETPWIDSGGLCGTRGQGVPLIGFAMRQKAVPGGALFDCEYAGYFGSGAIAGPVRNGAPCRSSVEGDPLEGLQLRIVPRPPRLAATTVAAAVRRE